MKFKYIQTMDFTFKNIIVLNCRDIEEFNYKIEENKIIKINNEGSI